MKRTMWFILGITSLAFAAIGVVLPILPTTPLVILAAFAFSKSSERFEAWLLNSPTFGPIIADWRQNGAIAPRYKVIATGMMAAVFAISLILGVRPFVLVIQALCLGAAAAFVLSRPNH